MRMIRDVGGGGRDRVGNLCSWETLKELATIFSLERNDSILGT